MPSLIPQIPEIVNPYPEEDWEDIGDVQYETPLRLYRHIESVKMRDGRDDADYVVADDYVLNYALDGRPRAIIVPKGMLTDLASVPRVARSAVGRVGPHLEASIVHDFLYIAWQDIEGHGARRRDQIFADKLMRAAMRAANVDEEQLWLIYCSVKAFGWETYRKRDPEPRYVQL